MLRLEERKRDSVLGDQKLGSSVRIEGNGDSAIHRGITKIQPDTEMFGFLPSSRLLPKFHIG